MNQVPKIYIRFGDIPPNEISCQYDSNGEIIKKEDGVSVYDAVEIDNIIRVIMPRKPTATTAMTLYQLYSRFCSKKNPEIPILLVTGDEVGYGSDNEPLLKNIKIISKLNQNFQPQNE